MSKKFSLTLSALFLLFMASAPAQESLSIQAPLSEGSRQAIEQIVHQYILQHRKWCGIPSACTRSVSGQNNGSEPEKPCLSTALRHAPPELSDCISANADRAPSHDSVTRARNARALRLTAIRTRNVWVLNEMEKP